MRLMSSPENGLKILWALLSYLAFFAIISMSIVYIIIPYIRNTITSPGYIKELSSSIVLVVFLFHLPVILVCLAALCVFTRDVCFGYKSPSASSTISSLLVYVTGLICLFVSDGYLFVSFFSHIPFNREHILFIYTAVMVVSSYIGIIVNRVAFLLGRKL